MKKFTLVSDVISRTNIPVVVVRATPEEVMKEYKKVSLKGQRLAEGCSIVLLSSVNSALITFNNRTREVEDVLFIKPSITKTIEKEIDENHEITVDDMFNKSGVKVIDTEFTSLNVKIVKFKEEISNVIAIIASEIKLPKTFNVYSIKAHLYRITSELLEESLMCPCELNETPRSEFMDRGQNLILANENCEEAILYTSSGDYVQLDNFDTSLVSRCANKSMTDNYWFSEEEFDGEIKEFCVVVSAKDESGEEVEPKELKPEPSAYKDIEKLDFLVNLNKEAAEGKLSEVVGRKNELNQLLKNLLRIKKPSNIIIGPAGVGKSALYELLAQELIKGNVPEPLKDIILVDLNIGGALAGTRYRGEFEEKIHKVIKLIEKHPNIVLVVDEVHQIVGAGESSESTVDMSNMLKPYLARGKVRIIGSTTKEEYEKYIKPQEALSRRFNVIEMFEPSKEETIEMMVSYTKTIKDRFMIDLSKRLDSIYEDCKHQKGRMPDIALEAMETVAIDEYLNRKDDAKCQ